jgi:nucleoid-associated protein YgaU
MIDNLSAYNAYQDAKVFQLPSGNYTIRQPIIWQAQPNDKYYTIKKDDTLESIAQNAYQTYKENACMYWWLIADVNKIYTPLDLSSYIGNKILIPDILRLDFVRSNF